MEKRTSGKQLALLTALLAAVWVPGGLALDAAALREALRQTTLEQVRTAYPDAQIEVEVAAFHSAVANKPCADFKLEVKASRLYGRVPVMVRCAGAAPWTFYASTQVTAAVPVVVSRQPITSGTTISEDMLQTRHLDMTRLRSQVMRKPEDVLGKVAKRNINSGQPIYMNQVKTPWAVQKGQRIAIQARIGNTYVATHGTALQNGHIGEQIAVRNDASEKLIRPWVSAPGTVTTRPR